MGTDATDAARKFSHSAGGRFKGHERATESVATPEPAKESGAASQYGRECIQRHTKNSSSRRRSRDRLTPVGIRTGNIFYQGLIWLHKSKLCQFLNLKTNALFHQRVGPDNPERLAYEDRFDLPRDRGEIAGGHSGRRHVARGGTRRQPAFCFPAAHRGAFLRRFTTTTTAGLVGVMRLPALAVNRDRARDCGMPYCSSHR
ncbi:hypothetical protein CA85_09300 [Allorhodopirellula solitaria]|uniref:Uncharacterized protein n=1 Tax=Allorhodopirellula solitaria TaxID=2527987 RepID=A0A5C5YE73_9BACT|nr:hypothetical protein CA85_09300 [Allorhodopirellula solitaria]